MRKQIKQARDLEKKLNREGNRKEEYCRKCKKYRIMFTRIEPTNAWLECSHCKSIIKI